MTQFKLMYSGMPESAKTVRALCAEAAATEFFNESPQNRSVIVTWGLLRERVFQPEFFGLALPASDNVTESGELPQALEAEEERPRQFPISIPELPILSSIARHYLLLSKLATWRFSLCVLFELALSLVLALGVTKLLELGPRTSLDLLSTFDLILGAVVIAPLAETLLIQVIFGELARAASLSFWWQVAAMTLAFMLAHTNEGWGTMVCIGLCGGFYFGYAYAARRNLSFGAAYWTTTLLHFLNNAIAVTFLIALRDS